MYWDRQDVCCTFITEYENHISQQLRPGFLAQIKALGFNAMKKNRISRKMVIRGHSSSRIIMGQLKGDAGPSGRTK